MYDAAESERILTNSADNQTCNYSHDDLSRIAQADCGSGGWGQSFTYDPVGNITKNVLASHSGNSFQPTYNSATNRFSSIPGASVSYDANGNVLTDGSHTYSWDAFGNSISLDGVGLTFDALDRMVEQNRSGAYTEIVYSPGGAKLALMSGTGGQTLQKAFVPLTGGATAVYTSSGLDHYRHSDWLGSARLTSSPARAVLSTTAYAPFGETYAPSGTADLSFTGQNSDTASDDYDFLYREYSNQGRWSSPDPAGLAAVDPTLPQSWNRYAYVLNNPLGLTDPLGLWCAWQDGTHDSIEAEGGIDEQGCIDGGGVWDPTNTITGCDSSWNCTLGDGSTTSVAGICGDNFGCTLNITDSVTVNGGGSNGSGGFFGGIKDNFLDFLAANANYLPGVCTAGVFGFGTGGPGNASRGVEGGFLWDKHIGSPSTTERLGEVSYGPIGFGATPSEVLVFAETAKVKGFSAGPVFAGSPTNGFINNSGISMGFWAGKLGHRKLGPIPAAGGAGVGAYLTFSSAANCLQKK